MGRAARDRGITIEFDVPFHHVDALGIVWHGRYFEYLDMARAALMRTYDLDVEAVHDLGYRVVVVECHCRYSFPLHHKDRFAVRAWLAERNHRLRLAFDIRNLTHGRRSARAWMSLALTDPTGRLLSEPPDAIRQRFDR